MTYRVLLVGLGRIGWQGFRDYRAIETHGSTLMAMRSQRISLVAGVDTDATRRSDFQLATGLHVYEHIEAALSIEAPAIVTICTPPETHCHLTKLVYESNIKCVVCEKPMAVDAKECKEMIAAAAGRPLIIGHQRRYEQRHRLLRAFLRSETLGQPIAATARFSGSYLNNGTHAADTLNFLVGESVPQSIKQVNGDEFDVNIACERGMVILKSRGDYEPGYLETMYNDAIECIETGKTPECSGENGLEAVRMALAAEETSAAEAA